MIVTRLWLFFGIAGMAAATSLTASFSFDSTKIGSTTYNLSATTGSSPDNTAISNYITGILKADGCTGCSVAVTGAYVDTTYTADGHVVGPGGTSLTLGDSEGATSNSTLPGSTDNFLANTSNSGAQGTPASTQIMMTFSGLTISHISFDYEIFPDITCTQLNTQNNTYCGTNNKNLPSLELEAGNGKLSPVTSFGTGGTMYAVAPSSNGSDGSSYRSPNGSALTDHNPETAPQYIGTWSGALTNANQVDFVDWPATIALDNLHITYTPTSAVPEPVSVLLFGTLVAGLALRKKFRKTV